MLCKRIIPCLDIKDGRTVKGTNFVNLKDAGDPLDLAIKYCEDGADEIVFLDITATLENRKTTYNLVNKLAKHLSIMFTVGGGIKTLEDADKLFENGADKVSINSAAIHNSNLIYQIAQKYGSQALVVAIDTKKIEEINFVFINGGKLKTNWETIDWAKEVYNLGAGEILLTAMDNDGTKNGFEKEVTKLINETINIPIIASGGAGNMQDFANVLQYADAALAASVFHYGTIQIPALKKYLETKNIKTRKL